MHFRASCQNSIFLSLVYDKHENITGPIMDPADTVQGELHAQNCLEISLLLYKRFPDPNVHNKYLSFPSIPSSPLLQLSHVLYYLVLFSF